MAPSIRQTIELIGGDEIKRQLQAMGQAGEQAFAQLDRAFKAQGVADRLSSIGQNVSQLGESFKLGVASAQGFGNQLEAIGRNGLKLVGTLAAIGGGIAGFARLAAGSAKNLDDQAQAIGVSVEKYQQLGFAASSAGIKSQQFTQALAQLSTKATDTAKEQTRSVVDLAKQVVDNLRAGGVVVSGFGGNVTTSLGNIGEAAKRVQAQMQAAGIPANLQQITEALQRVADKSPEAAKELIKLGATAPKFTAIQNLSQLADTGKTVFEELKVQVTDLAGKVRPADEILGDLADRFKALPDGPQKTAAAMKLFGQELGVRMIPLLNKGSAGLNDLFEEFNRLGVGVSLADTKVGRTTVEAFTKLGTALDQIKTKLGLVFAPLATEGANALTAFITQNFGTLDKFAKDLEGQIAPKIRAFFTLLTGKDAGGDNQAILQIRQGIIDFGTSVQETFTGIIIPAFNGLMAILNQVAGAINSFFGTNISGTQLGIVLVIGQIIGVFGLLLPIIGVVTAAFTGFFAILSTGATAIGILVALFGGLPVAIAAALIAGAVAVFVFWDDIKKKAKETFDALPPFAQTALTEIGSIVSGIVSSISGAVASTVQNVVSLVTGYIDLLRRAFEFAKSILPNGGGTSGAISNPAGDVGFAAGGYTGHGGRYQPAGIVHRGEHVQPASVVSQPGVLAFLETLRRTGDLGSTINRFMRGFSMGGLVERMNTAMSPLAFPGFAAGGLVPALAAGGGRSLHPVTIEFGGRSIGGLFAPTDVVSILQQEAVRDRIKATGPRSPNRKR